MIESEREREDERGGREREGESKREGSLISLRYKSPLFWSSLNLEGSQATASRFAPEGGLACKTESDLSSHHAPLIQLRHLLTPTSSEMVPEPYR